MLINSVFRLRSTNHLNTRLQLRDERAHAYRLMPWLALVMISFSIVDWLVAPNGSIITFFGVRLLAVIFSRYLYLFTRGRKRYGTRLFLTVAPYMYAVEYIMLSQDLTQTPYFSGLALVIITSSMLFPVRTKIASIVYSLGLFPLWIWMALYPFPNVMDNLTVLLMSVGAVYVCSVNSGQVYADLRARLVASEALARDLGKREKEIRQKAEELVKRQIFESQFSPQVVNAILKNRAITHNMQRSQIVNIVIDIQNSTSKAHSISPQHYKEVVEEVLDVFSAACLKWNITLDKFTGDGVQAFAGAPISAPDDFRRALKACGEMIQMMHARKSHLQSLWKDELNIRFAICSGEALIGFIGRGIFKSYTAVGDMVSFTHRLSSVAEPWTIATHAWNHLEASVESMAGFTTEYRMVSGLKGFGDKKFKIAILTPDAEEGIADAGRCNICQTPLVLEETLAGLPRIFCPGCQSKAAQAA